jgi:hypothetical protein
MISPGPYRQIRTLCSVRQSALTTLKRVLFTRPDDGLGILLRIDSIGSKEILIEISGVVLLKSERSVVAMNHERGPGFITLAVT